MNKALNKEQKRDGQQRAASAAGWSVSYRIKAKRGQQSCWQWLEKEDGHYLL